MVIRRKEDTYMNSAARGQTRYAQLVKINMKLPQIVFITDFGTIKEYIIELEEYWKEMVSRNYLELSDKGG